MSRPVFEGVFPISGDFNALPVNSLGPAIGYYVQVLGFSLLSKDETTAILERDKVRMGLVESEEDPEAVSCYFSVKNLDTLREEYAMKGIEPTPIRNESHDGKPYRVFFAREPYGVCFCFGEPA